MTDLRRKVTDISTFSPVLALVLKHPTNPFLSENSFNVLSISSDCSGVSKSILFSNKIQGNLPPSGKTVDSSTDSFQLIVLKIINNLFTPVK
ncbi:MAG: hypothetical protein MJ252_10110 [archaeon]|nr:hypothetical protein [archaeon]